MKHSIMYYVYRLLYSITLDRKWLLKCIDVIQQDTRDEVTAFINNKEE